MDIDHEMCLAWMALSRVPSIEVSGSANNSINSCSGNNGQIIIEMTYSPVTIV